MIPRLWLIVISVVAMGAGGFAAWPVRPRPTSVPVVPQLEPEPHMSAALDLAAFRVPIWVAEAPPPPPPAPAPAPLPPPTLKLQLLAIMRDRENGRTAAVYDPDSDRVVVVAAGQKLGRRSVEEVLDTSLTLRDETGTRKLVLMEGGSP